MASRAFHDAVKRRSIATTVIISTDFGEYPLPGVIEDAWRMARKRKSGEIDRRTAAGKRLARWEREFLAQKQKEWLDGSNLDIPA